MTVHEEHPAFLDNVLEWVHQGYPHGVPQKDYFALLALLMRSLTEEEVVKAASSILKEGDFDTPVTADQIRGQVAFGCLLSEAFQTSCDETRLQDCITTGVDGWTGLDCTAPAADEPIRMCDATVDEFHDCYHAQLDQYADLANATCADLDSTGTGDVRRACKSEEIHRRHRLV